MKLIWKFNLVLLAIFAIGFVSAGYVSHIVLQNNAREEMLHSARLVMETALATRGYTSTQVGYNTNCCGLSIQYRHIGVGVAARNEWRAAFAVANFGSFGNLRRNERLF